VTYFNKKPYASIDAEAGVPHFEKNIEHGVVFLR
jgi:CO dehydrogenase nickel-insertion accessory protein CooC1